MYAKPIFPDSEQVYTAFVNIYIRRSGVHIPGAKWRSSYDADFHLYPDAAYRINVKPKAVK